MKWGWRGYWGHQGCWGYWGFWCKGNHLVSKVKEAVEVIEASNVIRTVVVIDATEVFRTTQILKINNIVARITLFRCFEKKKFLNKLMEFYRNFAISQNWGCGGHGDYFWPNQRIITQMPPTQDSQTTFKPNLTCIFLFPRTRYIMSIPNGWPCTFDHHCESKTFDVTTDHFYQTHGFDPEILEIT